MRIIEVCGQRIRDFRGQEPANRERVQLSPAQQKSVDRQDSRDFWMIRGLFIGVTLILGALEIYLNTVIFSGLVAVIGLAFSGIAILSIVMSTFLSRSHNRAVRAIARASDGVGLATSTAVCAVWFYGASSIQTAEDRGKEWEVASTSFQVASATAEGNYQAAVDRYNACRNRPIASLPREERAGALASCEEIAHSKSDFPVTVPNPGPRPVETKASTANDWKPRIRGLGIFGIVVSVVSIALMIGCASTPSMPTVSMVDQASVLAEIKTGKLTQWPMLTREQMRQSAALLSVRQGRDKAWPIPPIREIFGPRYKDWRPVFCSASNLVQLSYSPSLSKLSKSLLTGAVLHFRKVREEVPAGEVVCDSETVDMRQPATGETAGLLSQPVAATNLRQSAAVLAVLAADEKRKTRVICNGQFKLIPRSPSGWKLCPGPESRLTDRYLCSFTEEEGQKALSQDGETQIETVSQILIKKERVDLIPRSGQVVDIKTKAVNG